MSLRSNLSFSACISRVSSPIVPLLPAGEAGQVRPGCAPTVGLGEPCSPWVRHSQLQSHSWHLWSKLELCVGEISTDCRQEHYTHTSEHCARHSGAAVPRPETQSPGRCRLCLANCGGLNGTLLSGTKRMVSE